MWSPLRIDHHGWQLAFLAVSRLGADRPEARPRRPHPRPFQRPVDRHRARRCCPISPSSARRGAALGWDDGATSRRLVAYGVSLAGGVALGFLLFASYANRAAGLRRAVAGLAVGAGRGGRDRRGARHGPDRPSPGCASAAAAAGRGVARRRLRPFLAALPRPARKSRSAGRVSLARGTCSRRGRSTATARDVIVAVCAIPVIGLLGYLAILAKVRGDGPAVRARGSPSPPPPSPPPACSSGRAAPAPPPSSSPSPARWRSAGW